MNKIFIKFMEEKIFKEIINFLNSSNYERNLFLLLDYKEEKKDVFFTVKEVLYVNKNKQKYSIDTDDEVISEIIKKAWEQNLCLGEIHSHPFSNKGTTFSYFDISELDKFVPYVFWRLKNKPYLALVFGKNDFDAKVWISNSIKAAPLSSILVGNKKLKPTNIFFNEEGYVGRK